MWGWVCVGVRCECVGVGKCGCVGVGLGVCGCKV